MPMQAEFLIIGAGIAGASAAYELSKQDAVLLLEHEASAGLSFNRSHRRGAANARGS
jgi:glycine/D-amino acid oxidase-like deaminating enzyme